jgi:1-acyl-sn-glycerol-3-phosphate acyltransferase
LKSLLKNIFGFFAAIIFAITLILTIPCYFLIFQFSSAKRAPHLAHRIISRTWARILFLFFGVRLIIKGTEKIKTNQTYVFIANHRSLLDVPAYALATTHTFRFLAKEELTRIPLLGYVIRKLYISVNRKDKSARSRSMEKMVQSLRNGISVFICPEGTRNTTDQQLLEFRDGAFRLAISAQVPIAVLTLNRSDKLLSPRKPMELSPGTIFGYWSDPIPTTGMTESDLELLKTKARNAMLASRRSVVS